MMAIPCCYCLTEKQNIKSPRYEGLLVFYDGINTLAVKALEIYVVCILFVNADWMIIAYTSSTEGGTFPNLCHAFIQQYIGNPLKIECCM